MRPNRSLAAAKAHLATPVIVFALAAAAACSGRDRADGAGGDTFKPPIEQYCSPGQVRACGIEIGRSGNVVDCAKGTQTCLESKAWSTCEASGATFKAAAPPAKSGAGLSTNAVGGASTNCVDNPCNPLCQTFNDSPDTGIVSDAVVTTTIGEGVLLSESNVPGGFQNKGTLDGQCASAAGSISRMEACQFDMKCGTKADGSGGCVPFVSGEKNSCAGVDITAPPVCVSNTALSYRNLTVCNRGSVDLTQNIQCMGYPGNSPQYPEASPGAGLVVLQTGSTVDPATGTTNPITAANPLKAGSCRVYHVPNSNFQSNGTMSIMCNPPSTGTAVKTTLYTNPTTVESVDFTNKDFALNDADSLASATSEFRVERIIPGLFATGVTGAVGFSAATLTNMTGAANSVGAATALPTTTSAFVSPTSATNGGGGTWTPSAASTLLGDVLTLADGKAATSVIDTFDYSWLLTRGYTIPGATGAITRLDVSVDATYSAPVGDITGEVYLRKADNTTFLGRQYVRNGTVSFTFPWGALLATEVPTLQVWIAAVGQSWSGAKSMTLDRVRVAGAYHDPNYARANLNGYTWAAPPAGTYTGVRINPTWKSSAASGAVLYVYVKKVSDNSTVASGFFSTPTGYTAGSWITTQATVATATGLTSADLAAGLYAYVEAYPVGGGTLELDSLELSPVYATGAAERGLRFKGFGISVPPGATNVQLTALANYKIDPLAAGDYITGRVLSISGSTTTLISQSTASPPNNAFNLYQLGYQAIAPANYGLIEDPLLAVDIAVGKGAAALTTAGSSLASLESLTMRLQYDAVVGAAVPECNPYNNWTVNKANPPTMCAPVTTTTYPPWTMSRVFNAVCADTNHRPKWRMLGYTSTTPAGTKIEFRVRTYAADSTGACVPQAAVTADLPTPVATARLGPPDTQVCNLAAAPTTTCPAYLDTRTDIDPLKPCLQLDAYGVPAVAPATPASPTLTDWRVTYDCVEVE